MPLTEQSPLDNALSRIIGEPGSSVSQPVTQTPVQNLISYETPFAKGISNTMKLGAEQPYTAPAAAAPVSAAPPPIATVAPAPAAALTTAATAPAPTTPLAAAPAPALVKPIYPGGGAQGVPWQTTAKYWTDMEAYKKAGGV